MSGLQLMVDQDKCCGFGNCVLVAPGLFDLDDDRHLAYALEPEIGPGARGAVDRAMDGCPTDAISLAP